jgi:hypothetical protein
MTLNIKHLKVFTAYYLLLPVGVFFVFWLKIFFAVPLVSIIIYCAYHYASSQPSIKVKITVPQLIFIVLIAIFWVSHSGIGGFGVQTVDHAKYNSMFKELVENEPPVKAIYQNQKIFLSAYLGYYISIPLLFKSWLSWPVLMLILNIYTTIAVIATFLWIGILVGHFKPWVYLIFIFFSGIEILPYLFQNGSSALTNLYNNFWGVQPFWSTMLDADSKLFLRSNTHALYWGVPHAISCWLGMSLFFYEFNSEKNISKSPIYLVPISFWSPFILIGIAPFVIIFLFQNGIKKLISISNILLIPVLVIVIWFVTSVPVSKLEKGFVFHEFDRLKNLFTQISHYLIYYFSEVGIWLIIVLTIFMKNKNKELQKILFTISLCLLILPLYKLGKWNDWGQWVPAPSLFLLCIFVIKAVDVKLNSNILKYSLVTLLIMASWDPIYHIGFSISNLGLVSKNTLPAIDNVDSMVDSSVKREWPIEQTYANQEASFFKYMIKKEEK